MGHRLVWVDIPVTDIDRAIKFYTAVLGAAVKRQESPGVTMAILPHAQGEIGGCLFVKEGEAPSAHGPLIYLSAQGRLEEAVQAVAPAGGQVVKPKHSIGQYGFRAVILDSEGNRIALHSM